MLWICVNIKQTTNKNAVICKGKSEESAVFLTSRIYKFTKKQISKILFHHMAGDSSVGKSLPQNDGVTRPFLYLTENLV